MTDDISKGRPPVSDETALCTWVVSGTQAAPRVRLTLTDKRVWREDRWGGSTNLESIPIDEVRWTALRRVHYPWLLIVAALALVALVLLLIVGHGEQGSGYSSTIRSFAGYLIETIVGSIVAYLFTRRVAGIVGGAAGRLPLALRVLDVSLWGGQKQREDAALFFTVAEVEALRMRGSSHRRRGSVHSRVVRSLRGPQIPRTLGGEVDERLRELGIRIAAALALQLAGWGATAILPSEPRDDLADSVLGTATAEPDPRDLLAQTLSQTHAPAANMPPRGSPFGGGQRNLPSIPRTPPAQHSPPAPAVAPAPVVPSPTAAVPTPAAPVALGIGTTPPGMGLVPAGSFTMGTDSGRPYEGPAHPVTISKSFFIDLHETTVREYGVCVTSGRCTEPSVHGPAASASQMETMATLCNAAQPDRGDHPVNCVDRSQAETYCGFAGKRLPTEAEWEFAARGSDGRTYPWGEDAPACNHAVVSGCSKAVEGLANTRPVGSLPAGRSPIGADDQAGNVWEWVSDAWDNSAYTKTQGADPFIAPAAGGMPLGVLRGGSWDFAASHLRSTTRLKFSAGSGHVSTGFRCAKTAE